MFWHAGPSNKCNLLQTSYSINIPVTEKKLLEEKQLIHSLLRAENGDKQIAVLKNAKREHLNTVVFMANQCYKDRQLLKNFSPKDQTYLRSKQSSVVSALDNVKVSNLTKNQMLEILSKVAAIDEGKIFRKLLKSYVVKKNDD